MKPLHKLSVKNSITGYRRKTSIVYLFWNISIVASNDFMVGVIHFFFIYWLKIVLSSLLLCARNRLCHLFFRINLPMSILDLLTLNRFPNVFYNELYDFFVLKFPYEPHSLSCHFLFKVLMPVCVFVNKIKEQNQQPL